MRIAFIGSGHWAPIKFAESISSDIYIVRYEHHNTLLKYLSVLKAFFFSFKMPKYDIYLIDGDISLFIAVVKKIFLREKCKIIVRVNNALFSRYGLSRYKIVLAKFLTRRIDGVISVSPLIDEDVKKSGIPSRIVYSFLKDTSFFKIKPDFENENILGIGTTVNMRTGTDILVDAFKLAKQKDENIGKLFVLGHKFVIKNLIEKNENEDIEFTGYRNPKDYMKKCSVFVHPARFEPGPNTVIEAMAAGLVPIVSNKTGHKYIVEKIDRKLVVNSLNPADYAYTILYLLKDKKELEKLSTKCKDIAKEYTKEKQTEKFRTAFFDLLREIS